MSIDPGPAPGVSPEPVGPGSVRCPRCAAEVGPEQDWCLACGAPARTRLAPTPNWRLPVALVAAIVALSGLALGIAFVELTGDDDAVTPADTVSVPTVTPTGTTNPALPPTTPTTPAPGDAAAPTAPGATAPGEVPAPGATPAPEATPPPTTTPGGVTDTGMTTPPAAP